MSNNLSIMLWFPGNAAEAVEFYASVFKDAKPGDKSYYTKAGHDQHHMNDGELATQDIHIKGLLITALNAGNEFKFNEAVSIVISTDDQAETDYYWEKLGAGGTYEDCGWLKDKFGVAWQVTPTILTELNKSPDAGVRARVMEAMMKMKKIIIADIEEAAKG